MMWKVHEEELCLWCVMLNVWRVTINHSISDKLGGSEFYCYSCGDEIWSSHHMPTPSHHHQVLPGHSQLVLSYHLQFIPWLMVMLYHGCLVTARLICLQLKGGSPAFSSSVTNIRTCAGRLGLDCGDYKHTLTTDNTSNRQIKTMTNLLIYRPW